LREETSRRMALDGSVQRARPPGKQQGSPEDNEPGCHESPEIAQLTGTSHGRTTRSQTYADINASTRPAPTFGTTVLSDSVFSLATARYAMPKHTYRHAQSTPWIVGPRIGTERPGSIPFHVIQAAARPMRVVTRTRVAACRPRRVGNDCHDSPPCRSYQGTRLRSHAGHGGVKSCEYATDDHHRRRARTWLAVRNMSHTTARVPSPRSTTGDIAMILRTLLLAVMSAFITMATTTQAAASRRTGRSVEVCLRAPRRGTGLRRIVRCYNHPRGAHRQPTFTSRRAMSIKSFKYEGIDLFVGAHSGTDYTWKCDSHHVGYVFSEQLNRTAGETLIDPVQPLELRAVRGVLREWWRPMLRDGALLQNGLLPLLRSSRDAAHALHLVSRSDRLEARRRQVGIGHAGSAVDVSHPKCAGAVAGPAA
jgi:hypothetical protein